MGECRQRWKNKDTSLVSQESNLQSDSSTRDENIRIWVWSPMAIIELVRVRKAQLYLIIFLRRMSSRLTRLHFFRFHYNSDSLVKFYHSVRGLLTVPTWFLSRSGPKQSGVMIYGLLTVATQFLAKLGPKLSWKLNDMESVLLNMNCFHMSGQCALLCKLLLTLTTSIPNAFMNNLDMPCQTTLCCSFVITLITGIFDTFMCSFLICFLTLLWSAYCLAH